MHKMLKHALCLTFLLSGTAGAVAPYYSIRSQSENIARELVGAGWNTQINLCDMDCWYGNFAITAEYAKSFKPCYIAQCLFGCWNNNCSPCATSCSTSCNPCGPCNSCGPCYDNCCDDSYVVRISGSTVEGRGGSDWLADYFGLPTDYQSCVTFEPRISNFLVDFNLYLGLDEWCQGMYFRIHAPVVHTRWDLNMCECIGNRGVLNHPAGYFNKTFDVVDTDTIGILRSNLVPSFASFISGCGVINDPTISFSPLCYAKMDCCERKKTALSDIQMALGWNFWCDCDYHVGLNIRAVAPTGNRPEGCYLFEPIVGNGKHWELGAGFTSHWDFWHDECECSCASFYFDMNITHLFKTKQCRTFDLNCKPLSRYMLAAKFKTPVENLYAGEIGPVTKPIKQFAGIYSPVANLTNIPVDVSIGVQGDLAFMLQYIHCNWSFDLGYNFWGRSCEKIECRCDCCPCFEENTWALKGDAFMYGYNTVAEPLAVALSASQSGATICKGTNNYPDGDKTASIEYFQNPGADRRAKAWYDSAGTIELESYDSVGPAQVYTSKDPVFISYCDFDLCGARTKGLSHKIFAHVDYTWCDNECWVPYLGVGFEAEFGHKPCDDCCYNDCNTCLPCNPCSTSCNPCGPCNTNCCDNNCCDDSCCTCALSQWGVWLKGGVAFN